MSWKVKITNKASKQMRRIPKKDANRLLFILEGLTNNPYQGDIEKIKSENNVWRRRVGNYRILYEIKPKQRQIDIFRIRRRATTTYRK